MASFLLYSPLSPFPSLKPTPAKPPPQIRGPPGGPIQPSRHYPTPLPKALSPCPRPDPAASSLAQGWLSLAGRQPGAHLCTGRLPTSPGAAPAAPRPGPGSAGDNFLLPAPGVGAVPASPASSPRGIGSAAGRPRPQPNLGCELSRLAAGAGPLLFPRPPQTRVSRPGIPHHSSYRGLWCPGAPAFDSRVCASRNVLGCEQPRFFPPSVRRLVEGPLSPSPGMGPGKWSQPGPSLTRQPEDPTFSWFPL